MRAVAAQSVAPTGAFGYLIHAAFAQVATSTSFPTGVAILGVMNFDGAGTCTGPYTYEIDSDSAQVKQTTTGMLTGTYTTNPDGTGSITVSLDLGVNLTLAVVAAEGGQSLRLFATSFQFPATNCGCAIGGITLTGIARATPAPSLSGSFGAELINFPIAGGEIGTLTFDGAGNANFSLTFMGAADANGTPPAPFPYTQPGTYTINSDGTGSVSLPAVAGVTNARTFVFVTTDNGSGILTMQTNRAGSGVVFGTARMQ